MCTYFRQLSHLTEVESDRLQWSCDRIRLRHGLDIVLEEPSSPPPPSSLPYPEIYQTTRCNYPD
jgi:hypothetical protein